MLARAAALRRPHELRPAGHHPWLGVAGGCGQPASIICEIRATFVTLVMKVRDLDPLGGRTPASFEYPAPARMVRLLPRPCRLALIRPERAEFQLAAVSLRVLPATTTNIMYFMGPRSLARRL